MTRSAAIVALASAVSAHPGLSAVTTIGINASKLSVRFSSKDPHAISAIRHMAIRAGAKRFTGTIGVDIIPGVLTAHF